MKKALITGATSGIGEAVAKLLESRGVEVIVTGRNEAALKQFSGKKLVLDLAKDRAALIDLIRQEAPDIVINNAGFGVYGSAVDISIDEELEVVEVNVKALLEITLEAGKALKAQQKSGTIVNVSSAGGFQPYPTFAVYTASKAFVTHLSQSLDVELMPYNIRVLAFCPGMVSTSFSSRASHGKRESQKNIMSSTWVAEQILKQIESGTPVKIVDAKYAFIVRLAQFLIPNRWIAKALNKYAPLE